MRKLVVTVIALLGIGAARLAAQVMRVATRKQRSQPPTNASPVKLVRPAAALSCVLLTCLGLSLPAPAGAESSSQHHAPKDGLSFFCSSQTVYLSVGGDPSSGYFAFVRTAEVGGTRYFAGGPFAGSIPAEVTYTHGRFVAAIPVRTSLLPSSPTVGVLTISADLVEGRTQVFTSGGAGSGDSNQQTTSVHVSRSLTPSGDVLLTAPDGTEATASGCSGSLRMASTVVFSNPHATVETTKVAEVFCDPLTIGGDVYVLGMEQIVIPPDEAATVSLYGPVDRFGTLENGADRPTWEQGVSIELVDQDIGGVGATANLRLIADDSGIFPIHSGTWTAHLNVMIGRVQGVVALGDFAAVPVSCGAYFIEDRYVAAGGTPSTSRPPANDLPSDALPLAVGARTTAQTAGAAPDVEAPLECMLDEEGRSLVTNTVWYTVTGSGPVTIDTAGTRFDTAIAVYTRDDAGGLTPLAGACVDDIWIPFGPIRILDLQASLTFDAQPGVTYLVQVGGTVADRNFGTLHVSADPAGATM
jgi:hypothetical protein